MHLTKLSMAAFAAVMAANASAATVYRDIDAGDVTAMVAALNEDLAGNVMVIRLAPGDYDLTGVEMLEGNHLYLENRALVGTDTDPWKTRLIGDGTKRILKAKNDTYDGNSNCRIQYLTCTNGCTTGNGGAVAGYPNIKNCVIIGNTAANGGGIGEYSYCKDSIIMNNTATSGGGGGYNVNYCRNCLITGNRASNNGGGLSAPLYGSAENCVISNNYSDASGGGTFNVRIVKDCYVAGNTAQYYGGGLANSQTKAETWGWSRVENCTVCSNSNTSASDGDGGGIYGFYITNCTVFANSAANFGGGIYRARDTYGCTIYDNTAVKDGGGIYDDFFGGVQNCTVSNNVAGASGGGICNVRYVDNCVIVKNKSQTQGGGTVNWQMSATSWGMPWIKDSIVCDNQSVTTGGGGVYGYLGVTNCVIAGNVANSAGGGISYAGDVYDCVISNNTTTSYGGGAYCTKKLEKCLIAGNTTTGANGGGVCGNPNNLSENYIIVDSVVCSNRTTNTTSGGYGGGTYGCYITNTLIFANYGMHGGGTAKARTLYNCDVHDNYGSGMGGGVYDCAYAKNSRIYDNISSGSHGNGVYTVFDSCDISGTGISGGRAVNTIFHDIGREVVLKNPYKTIAVSNANVYTGIPVATNCLFVNNVAASKHNYYGKICPSAYGQVLFQGATGGAASRSGYLVNCSIVSNWTGQTLGYAKSTDYPWHVENCVFYGNRCYYGDVDIVSYDGGQWRTIAEGAIYFKNCAYGKATNEFKNIDDFKDPNGQLYKYGADGFPSVPGFTGDAVHPYSLARKSALRGKGGVETWMETATDIVGNPRLRDNKCDIGAYQCWLPNIGFLIKVQ